jgi:hypothetical protein
MRLNVPFALNAFNGPRSDDSRSLGQVAMSIAAPSVDPGWCASIAASQGARRLLDSSTALVPL